MGRKYNCLVFPTNFDQISLENYFLECKKTFQHKSRVIFLSIGFQHDALANGF
jgi:hypothetical protein